MATSYPPDRFDDVPGDLKRVGAHRAPPRRGSGYVRLAWAAVTVVVLVSLGVTALFIGSGRIDLSAWFGTQSSPVASASPSAVAAEIDPDLSVTVLNGTGAADLGAALALAREVGDAPTVLSPSIADSGAQLMVVLGADFE